jgi:hypothetical protein
MRVMLALVATLYSATAMAQANLPTAAEKPPVQAKAKSHGASAKQEPVAAKLQACLEIDDATKERLDCYDAVFPPKPKAKASPAKAVADCRFTKEQDERLTCFNGFAEKLPKPQQ